MQHRIGHQIGQTGFVTRTARNTQRRDGGWLPRRGGVGGPPSRPQAFAAALDWDGRREYLR